MNRLTDLGDDLLGGTAKAGRAAFFT